MVADGGIHVRIGLVAFRNACNHQRLDVDNPQSRVVAGEVYPSIPRPAMAVVGKAWEPGLEDLGIGIVRAEQQPLLAAGNEVLPCEWGLPSVDELGLEADVAIDLLIIGCVQQVSHPRPHRGLEDLGCQHRQVPLALGVAKVTGIDHLVERLCVVDV